MAARIYHAAGEVFGDLTITGPGERVRRRLGWLCLCVCGRTVNIDGRSLRDGHTRSCGCRAPGGGRVHLHSNKPSGTAKCRTYRSWQSMRGRCDDPNDDHYAAYGARGICYDPRWTNYMEFFSDMGFRPEGMTLHRKDNNGNYCRENCEWATPRTQARNRRDTRHVQFMGQAKPASEWAFEYGVKPTVFIKRLNRGWEIARAL